MKKLICDRCGREINPPKSITGLIIASGLQLDNYDLCVSCAYYLKKYLKNEWPEVKGK